MKRLLNAMRQVSDPAEPQADVMEEERDPQGKEEPKVGSVGALGLGAALPPPAPWAPLRAPVWV